jgi:hypothetical protein
VFQPGKSYPAWVRISNGGAYQKDDKATHISRGWGIKLLGASGTETNTHDFLMITSPRFFIRDITHYPGFLKATGNGRIGFLTNLFFNLSSEERDVIFHRLRLKVTNLLESPEYSAVPYKYGDATVKYAVAPCGLSQPPVMPESQEPPRSAGPDYLEDSMNATLAASQNGVCYGFYIQKPRSESEDPIDNPTKAWGGSFERVATITFPHGQQKGGVADYEQNEETCEDMKLDPWNAGSANRPVGKTNLTRKAVYAALARFRRVELPEIYARFLRDPNDTSIPNEYRHELAKVRDPASVQPTAKSEREPSVDEGFRKLGIVR